jgi:hypothetical protein
VARKAITILDKEVLTKWKEKHQLTCHYPKKDKLTWGAVLFCVKFLCNNLYRKTWKIRSRYELRIYNCKIMRCTICEMEILLVA